MRAAPRSARPRRRCGGRRAAARPCRSSGSPAGGTRRRSGRRRRKRSSWPPRPNAIAEPASRPRWRTRKRRCLPSPTVESSVELAAVDEQRHARVAEAERRQPARAPRRARSPSSEPATTASTGDPRAQVVVGQHRVGVRGERRGERLDALGADRQARRRRGGRRSARGARRTRRARRAGRTSRSRAARALPVAVGAGDQHDGPAVALDEPRRDDADHALVPVLAGDDVAAVAAPRLRPRLDLVDRRAEDPLLDAPAARGSAPRARSASRVASAGSSVSSSSSAASGRPSRPGGVDPRREPEADRALVAGGRVDAGDAHQRPQPGLLRLREPPQAERARARGSRRRAARRRRRSRARRRRGAGRGTDGPGRAAPRRASRRRRCRRGRRTDSRPSAARRPGSPGTSRRAGGGR